MGTINHHTIIVTGWPEDKHSIFDAWHAADLAGCACSTPVQHAVNGLSTFIVVPDGSKEGWSESDEGDKARARFIDWLEENDWYSWVEVSQHEEYGAKVSRVRQSA